MSSIKLYSVNPKNDIELTDSNDFRISHKTNSLEVIYKQIKYVFGTISVSEVSQDISEEQFLQLAKLYIEFECNKRGLKKPLFNNTLKSINNINLSDTNLSFSKYISVKDYEQFIKKGKWQLGSIEQYRKIENDNKRDELEGLSILNFNINNHLVTVNCTGGFNYLILCGSNISNSNYHKSKFGAVELKISSLNSFCNAIKKTINAKRFFIQNVQYNSLMFYNDSTKYAIKNFEVNKVISRELLELISLNILYPSLFVKSEEFRPESEMRIVFEMDKTIKKPRAIHNKMLLDYVAAQ